MVKFEYYDMIYQIYLFYQVFLNYFFYIGEEQPMNLGYFIFVPFYNLKAFNRDYLYMLKKLVDFFFKYTAPFSLEASLIGLEPPKVSTKYNFSIKLNFVAFI